MDGHNLEFYRACEAGDVEKVRVMLEKRYLFTRQSQLASNIYIDELFQIDVNKKQDDDNTPLIIASSKGHSRVVSLILSQITLKINEKNKYGTTALCAACIEGHAEVVRLLLEKPQINVNIAKNGDTSPIYWACEKGHTEVVSMLVKIKGLDANKAKNGESSPLIIACMRGHTEIVRLLLNNTNLNINKRRLSDDRSPFLIAVREKNYGITRLLLERGAMRDIKDPEFAEAMSFATVIGDKAIATLLNLHNDKFEMFRYAGNLDSEDPTMVTFIKRVVDLEKRKDEQKAEMKRLFAAEIYLLVLHVNAGKMNLVKIVICGFSIKNDKMRFVSVMRVLPPEVMMRICNLVYDVKRQFISEKDIEFVKQRLF